MTAPITVAIVDDQELIRTGLALILGSESDIEVVGLASDGADAISLLQKTRADLILMDIRMPDVDGIEATRRIQTAELSTRVLVLTTFGFDEYVFAAIRAGASGFLLKDTPRDELIRAVRTVAAGDALLAPSVTRQLIEAFAKEPPASALAPDLRFERLTDREREVLVLMARGLSNSDIAERLIIGEATVKTHVGRVLMKLEARDRVQAVVAAYETGLVRPGVSE